MNLSSAFNPIALLSDGPSSVALPAPRGSGAVRFDQAVEAAAAAQGGHRQTDAPDSIEGAAKQLVATTFFAPLFAQMRDSAFKSEMFHGGFGEDAFAAQLDEVLADRMAQRNDWALVDAVVRRLSPAGKAPAADGGDHARQTVSLDLSA